MTFHYNCDVLLKSSGNVTIKKKKLPKLIFSTVSFEVVLLVLYTAVSAEVFNYADNIVLFYYDFR